MSFFYQRLSLAIQYLLKILTNQKRIEHKLDVIRAEQIRQGKQLTTILQEVTPPQPGEAVSLEIVFSDPESLP